MVLDGNINVNKIVLGDNVNVIKMVLDGQNYLWQENA